MAGRSFHQRVSIPLVVMTATVLLLGGLGYFLAGIQTSSAKPEQPGLDVSSMSGRQLSVVVLNGTKTVGLARQVSDVLSGRGWTINRVGNWSNPELAASTVYYPVGAKKSAEALAREVGAEIAPATQNLSQSSLTYVIMK